LNRTLLIIKPDAVERNLIGLVIDRLERSRFKIVAMRLMQLSREQARQLYEVHKGKSFFDSLIDFMTSGPIVPILLEKENAVDDLRQLIGATDPARSACGTIRYEIGCDAQRNSVHASDSDDNADREIAFFF